MVKLIVLKVSTLERWKRWLNYASSCATQNKDTETVEAIRKVWSDIESTRSEMEKEK